MDPSRAFEDRGVSDWVTTGRTRSAASRSHCPCPNVLSPYPHPFEFNAFYKQLLLVNKSRRLMIAHLVAVRQRLMAIHSSKQSSASVIFHHA